jgi:hypothetical protein
MSPQDIWQSQSHDAPRVSVAYLRQRAENVQGKESRIGLITWLNLLVAVYMVYRGFTHFAGKPLTQGFFVLVFVMAIYGTIRWLRRGPRKPLIPEDAGVLDSLRFLRREVEQRISNLTRFSWMGALAGPLLGLILVPFLIENGWTSPGVSIAVFVQFGLIFPAVILFQTRRRKRALRQELATLDALATG